MSEKRTLTVDEAAEYLGISRGLAYQGVRNGDIPALRIGGRWLVPKEKLDALLRGGTISDSPT